MAVSHALAVLGWSELPDDQAPAQQIWLDDEALADHFDRARERMKNGSSGDSSWEDVPADSQNELTKGFRKR